MLTTRHASGNCLISAVFACVTEISLTRLNA